MQPKRNLWSKLLSYWDNLFSVSALGKGTCLSGTDSSFRVTWVIIQCGAASCLQCRVMYSKALHTWKVDWETERGKTSNIKSVNLLVSLWSFVKVMTLQHLRLQLNPGNCEGSDEWAWECWLVKYVAILATSEFKSFCFTLQNLYKKT